jgi:hypothetical protein
MPRSNLPDDSPKKYPPPDLFVNKALEYVQEAANKNITLRIMGGLAIYLHSKNCEGLWGSLGRLGEKVFTDIDFMSYSYLNSKILEFFKKKGYSYEQDFLNIGRKRLIFTGGAVPMIDVFFDKLEMCHVINLKDRLKVDSPTIPLADLLLEKLQIVRINEKDIKDVIVLLRAHNVGENDEDTINIKYIANLFYDDWGFYYTATTNLEKVRRYLDGCNVLTDKDRIDIANKINTIIAEVNSAPKSLHWKIRAKVGPRKKWYQEVDEV